MTAEPSCCPFCNAPVPRTTVSKNSRPQCPRCGETLPTQWAGSANGSPHTAEREEIEPVNTARWSNRSVAGLFLGLMVLMGLAGLGLALWTWGIRQSRHARQNPDFYAPHTYTPAYLPALGYLPADTHLVVGVHLADILKDKVASTLVEPPLPKLLELGLESVARRTGLTVAAIDHVVAGTSLTDGMPQATIVVRTRQPYSLEEVAAACPGKPLPHHKRPLFRIKLAPTGGGYLWCADEGTLVMVLRPDAAKIEDMDRIPAAPRHGAEGLPPALREVLENRLRQSVLWAAGYLHKRQPVDTLGQLLGLSPERAELLGNVKTFGLGFLLQEDVALIAAVEARDRHGVHSWQTYLETLDIPGSKSRKLAGPPLPPYLPASAIGMAGLTPAPMTAASLQLNECAGEKTAGADANWLTLQVRMDTDAARGLLDTMVPLPRERGATRR